MSLPRFVRAAVAARSSLRVLGVSASRHFPRHYPSAAQRLTTIAPSHTALSRQYTSQTSKFKTAKLSVGDYHQYADETLDVIVDNLEAIGDETEIDGFDVEYSQGVMTLKLGAHGTYVINKQPPNQQIWLSSPKSGPKRYDYDIESNKWFYHRDDHTLDGLLNEELSEALGQPIDVLAH